MLSLFTLAADFSIIANKEVDIDLLTQRVTKNIFTPNITETNLYCHITEKTTLIAAISS